MNNKLNAKQTMPYIFLLIIVIGVLILSSVGNTKYNKFKYD